MIPALTHPEVLTRDHGTAHRHTIFVLALLVGFEVISKVPATLHTPLMSAANSIHGIVLAGAMLIAVTAHDALGYILAFIACAFAAMNVVGGYVVTGRMLKMFTPVAHPGAGRETRAAAVTGNGEGPRQQRSRVARHERLRLDHPAALRGGRDLLRARPAPDELPRHARGAATRCPPPA